MTVPTELPIFKVLEFLPEDHPLWACKNLWQWDADYVTSSFKLSAAAFYAGVWTAKTAESLLVPAGMLDSHANEVASIILQFREEWNRTHGKQVEILKVAEIRGSRFNTGKLRMDLIDPLAMEGLAAVLTKGAIKYSQHNWRDGLPYTETIASLLRHTFAVLRGEDIDSETGLHHADHMQCNTMFLSNMMKTRPDMDDRWKPKASGLQQNPVRDDHKG